MITHRVKTKCNNFDCEFQSICKNQWSSRKRERICPDGMHFMSQIQQIRKTESEKLNSMPFNQYMEYGL